TFDNGPTRVVPGSHRWAPINVPVVNQGDWEPAPLSAEDQARVPQDLDAPYPGEILITSSAGAAVIMNSSGWHSGTRKTGHPAPQLPSATSSDSHHPDAPAYVPEAPRIGRTTEDTTLRVEPVAG